MLEIFNSEVFVKEVARQGIWAILYVGTVLYTLYELRRQMDVAAKREESMRQENLQIRNEAMSRENKLTTFISDITKQFERLATGVERLTMDVDEIKDELKLRKVKSEMDEKKSGGD